jgi:5-methyltetrahydrofolate--homocysteine methyltransferase
MQRQNFHVPLLIGGATTSRAHTALKIEPHYRSPTVWVKDASRAVGVAQSLISKELVDAFMVKIRAEYADIRERHKDRGPNKRLVSIDHARGQAFSGNWETYTPPGPNQPGITVFADYPLPELIECIDWTPFFNTWELAGHYPQIFDDAVVGIQARELFDDAQQMLKRVVAEKWLTAKGVVGLWPAARVGDDVEITIDDATTRIHCLRQQVDKPPGRPDFCLADFIAPKKSDVRDWIGGFAVTAGIGIETRLAEFERTHDDYSSILLKALADRLAEAFAERLHERVRKEFWGYAGDEALANEDLIGEKYRGIRPAPGYPACPDHTEKGTLWRLLDVESNTGMMITESFAMWPGSSETIARRRSWFYWFHQSHP